ncbi:hypothetical protein BTHERMOSOX_599 [Bathymodiolus thermophilus thioautotrophic gill symbiont]|uniref:DUF3530 domain-containing protein n=1 Tax=Bathymodiolus thermophilus thioautotrophic gill symbiont TaxID=2360 RepID=A0A3G3IMZ9_9GAMM|nr:DUF3530 family protein [Bathymodiolus thermophilus thioautotrophic gill symbiont]AYQ57160.1 hypothetical protein MS2017_1474 [Bathymodiolus thermophilus thioautotrophic gill symbiont]CAB5498179.1 hypothetical protein THERMOS_799 [Bathymodiolus thermophilus thioautotrophic gill symbiont]CAB5500563.1 hypothetical protein THERMOT_1257 [Bathymodiolus thermophilus thioautotrophic gill symbiont]SGZ72607.1 hypothetical protein BTHERMOSOX_599 [Bathymodiolus thermophilus thioautotrophic gill symbiont
MLNKKTIWALSLLFTQVSYAMFPIPSMPSLPHLPMFGDFNPNKLRAEFNQFVGVEPDFAREQRVVNEIADAVMDGDVEYLPLKNGKEVFSIFMESEADKPKGGVIILHNRGQHANWNDTIKPLRIGLAKTGWHTLSVQMPVLGKQAKYYDYVPIFPYSHARINAAIDFYKKQGITNIVLIAHGCGVHMAMSYVDKYGDGKINGFVGIGMGATDYKQKLVNGFPLYKMTTPILDIYAEQDFSGVRKLANYRGRLIKAANHTKSTQMTVKNADHYYKTPHAAERLTAKVAHWLNTL